MRIRRQQPQQTDSQDPQTGNWDVRTHSTGQDAVSGWAILPLRLFLGITFIYAGIQKITDPGFLHPGNANYIGSQLLSFSRGSPIGDVLVHLMEYATSIGVLAIFTELAIGTLVLLGVLTRSACIVGLVLSLVFFLSASWHAYPYFYGSDIVFVMCWLTLILAGPGPFALDSLVEGRLLTLLSSQTGSRAVTRLRPLLVRSGTRDQSGTHVVTSVITRAEALTGSIAAVALVVLGLLPRSKGGSSTQSLQGTNRPGGANPQGNGRQVAIPHGARKIGNISQLPANASGIVQDPATGDPTIIVRLPDNRVFAYDALCTHAGCTVDYDAQQHLLVCPCHGGEFDPAHGAQVVAGPPPSPLARVQMQIDGRGDIYIV